MIAATLQLLGVIALYTLVLIEAIYFALMPVLIVGILVWHSWERIREEVQNKRYRKQARKLLGDLRVI